MIDVHSHIVFDVDDGPKTLEESLDLIGESYAQGVRKIVSTSHRRKGMFETPEDKIFANFSKVKAEAEALYPDLTIIMVVNFITPQTLWRNLKRILFRVCTTLNLL